MSSLQILISGRLASSTKGNPQHQRHHATVNGHREDKSKFKGQGNNTKLNKC
jgi:hypothetical protein